MKDRTARERLLDILKSSERPSSDELVGLLREDPSLGKLLDAELRHAARVRLEQHKRLHDDNQSWFLDIDGSQILVRRNRSEYIARHLLLKQIGEGSSAAQALGMLSDACTEYVGFLYGKAEGNTSPWKELEPIFSFVNSKGGVGQWASRFRQAIEEAALATFDESIGVLEAESDWLGRAEDWLCSVARALHVSIDELRTRYRPMGLRGSYIRGAIVGIGGTRRGRGGAEEIVAEGIAEGITWHLIRRHNKIRGTSFELALSTNDESLRGSKVRFVLGGRHPVVTRETEIDQVPWLRNVDIGSTVPQDVFGTAVHLEEPPPIMALRVLRENGH